MFTFSYPTTNSQISSDIERISDYAENIAEYEGQYKARKAVISEAGLNDLRDLANTSLKSIDCALEIFENEEKQRQRAKPDYILRSPKILISSFQNEAVDNAISAPLPGDIPAFRKTAKRAKDSSKEQYQKALEKWYSGLRSSLLEMIEDETAPEFLEAKKSLGDEFL